MPYIPHTPDETKEMLNTIGVESIPQLFDEIPENLLSHSLEKIPDGINEQALMRLMKQRGQQLQLGMCFIGAGAYEHHIPAVVWDIATRGEFLTAYTPYQAEASQGSLQVLYEYQTMMASLLGMEIANASLYEGASAAAEAILMAMRCQEGRSSPNKSVLVAGTVHPLYRDTIKSIVSWQGIKLVELPYDLTTGTISLDNLNDYSKDSAAIVIPYPNFFGQLEKVDEMTDWAHENNMLVIAVVNPIAVALLKEPGQWGKTGADIVCGEGQPLGVPLNSGGPYFGFLATRQSLVRQLPGRLVGRTTDKAGNPGFVLTLQAREQHIRRAKATSNICTNQGLLVTAATIFMSLLGPEGLRQVALTSHLNTHKLIMLLEKIPGVKILFSKILFHEVVIQLPVSVDAVVEKMANEGIQAGFSLSSVYPELGEALLVCVTETKTAEDLQNYADLLATILKNTS